MSLSERVCGLSCEWIRVVDAPPCEWYWPGPSTPTFLFFKTTTLMRMVCDHRYYFGATTISSSVGFQMCALQLLPTLQFTVDSFEYGGICFSWPNSQSPFFFCFRAERFLFNT